VTGTRGLSPMQPSRPELSPDRRWLVVVAHPDDETLGCGALLSRLPCATVVHVTDGAPRHGGDARRHGFPDPAAYAAARWDEARSALDLAGVPAARHHGFGIADQGAAYRLVEITRRLLPDLAGADAVLTHAYEGGHPDHDAVCFAVHAAAKLAGSGVAGAIVEMPLYHAGPGGWIRQRFLPHPGAGPELSPAPSPAELDLKRRMAACHASQAATLAGFALDRELFRTAPPYDFGVLPNGGALLCERHGWNLDGPRWLTLVRAAEGALGLEGRLVASAGRAGTAP
jgi:LmbE family N-acetylglucosaminyl deacetylase